MRLISAVCVNAPDVPVIVTMAGPVVAVLLAVNVNVLVLVVLVALNSAVTPLGRPEAVRPTLPVKPPVGLTVIVLGMLPPCPTVNVLGAVERVKPCTVVVTTSTNFTGVRPATDAVTVTFPDWFGVA